MPVIARALPSSFFKAMTAKVVAKYDARIAERLIPAGRWAEGEDVADCVAALARG
jgi:3-oxoacyl-[acyl-carrier protein] reductase